MKIPAAKKLPHKVAPSGNAAPGGKKAPVGTSAAQQVMNEALAPLLASQAGQRTDLAGLTRDIIGYLKGTPAAIGRDYQGAINQQDGFAKTYANMQAAANPTRQINADVRAIGGPVEQRQQIGRELGSAFGGSAASLFKVGGQIPNTAFAADKAGALAFARSLPAIQGLAGQQLFAKLLQSQAADRQSAEASLAGQMEKQAEENAPDPNVYTDAQGRTVPKGYAFNAKGQLQSLGTVGAGGASGGGITPSVKSNTIRRATSAGSAALERTTDNIWAKTGDPAPTIKDSNGNSVPNPRYEEAVAWYQGQLPKSFGSAMYRVISAIGPHLKALGYSPAQIKRQAYLLVSAEITPPKGRRRG